MSLLVYINSNCCEYHLNQLDETITRTYDITEVSTSSASRKIAFLHVPFPYDDSFEVMVTMAIELTDRVIILCSELHNTTTEFIKKINHEKIYYFINGFINETPARLWMDWFITTTHVYRNSSILAQLNPYQVKEKYFDILLGQRRAHRDFIYTNTNHLSSYNIMTYLSDRTIPLQQQSTDSWVWESCGVTLPMTDIHHSVTTIDYYGTKVRLSQVIPITIYNQTAYSVVAETNFDNHYSFFTEKIVKPILARRLFIVFSGQYYLKNLRKFGFMTFDGIIDEGYDEVENPVERFGLVIEQMEYLISQPQNKILQLITPIVEHNQQLMLTTDWDTLFLDELSLQLCQTVPILHHLN